MVHFVPSAPRRGTRAVRKAALSLPLVAMSLAGPPSAVASPPTANAVRLVTDVGTTTATEVRQATSTGPSSHLMLIFPGGDSAYIFGHIKGLPVPVKATPPVATGPAVKHASPAKGNAVTKPHPVAARAPVKPVSGSEAQPVAPVRTFVGDFLVTCYDLSGHTATGALVSMESVAVDPSVIPLGTQLFVPGAGVRTADDTGGLIIGHRLDIWEPTYAACANWGAEEKPVYLINRED